MIRTAVELAAAFVAGDGLGDGFHSMNHGEAIRADISMVALHSPALEWQIVIRLLSRDAKISTCRLPFLAVRVDATATAAFIGDEVGEFMFQRPPQFFRLAFLELRVELNRPVRPPCPAGSRLHTWVP